MTLETYNSAQRLLVSVRDGNRFYQSLLSELRGCKRNIPKNDIFSCEATLDYIIEYVEHAHQQVEERAESMLSEL